MERLLEELVQISSTIDNFLFLEGRQGTELCLHFVLIFSLNFLIFEYRWSYAVQ